jgi:hypothetical protein
MLLVVVGPVIATTKQRCYHRALTVKQVAATEFFELLMMGVRTPETG